MLIIDKKDSFFNELRSEIKEKVEEKSQTET